jgi:hypothetical protein
LNGLISLQLNTFLEKAGFDDVKSLLSGFSCERDAEVECFIHEKAIPFECADHPRTTLICWLDDTTKSLSLIACYPVANQVFKLDRLTKSRQKSIRGGSVRDNNKDNTVSALLIGQIGKNDNAPITLNSYALFNQIFMSIHTINQLVPSRIVYLNCKNIPKLRTLYESKGFQLLTNINDDPVIHKTDQEDLLIYLMSMKELKRILEENNLI